MLGGTGVACYCLATELWRKGRTETNGQDRRPILNCPYGRGRRGKTGKARLRIRRLGVRIPPSAPGRSRSEACGPSRPDPGHRPQEVPHPYLLVKSDLVKSELPRKRCPSSSSRSWEAVTRRKTPRWPTSSSSGWSWRRPSCHRPPPRATGGSSTRIQRSRHLAPIRAPRDRHPRAGRRRPHIPYGPHRPQPRRGSKLFPRREGHQDSRRPPHRPRHHHRRGSVRTRPRGTCRDRGAARARRNPRAIATEAGPYEFGSRPSRWEDRLVPWLFLLGGLIFGVGWLVGVALL